MSKKIGRENDTVEVVEITPKSEVALREEAIQRFWEEHDIFKKSLERPGGGEPKGDFVFYDGPPFATGLPHYGHILASAIKDAIPRYRTMQGYHVRRQWGWDCHGLPLENLIEKQLGLATKRDIETYGVKNFNEAARAAVLEYRDDWQRIIPRMGRWADMEQDYKTMDSTYTESVWWVFTQLHEKGLVYEGFKGMHLCPRCGTTLSNFEVNLGYKDIKDIAVTVKLPLLDEAGKPTDTSLLVWTTTPWTLPGNLAAAVHQDYDYIELELEVSDVPDFPIKPGEKIIFANDSSIQVAVFGGTLTYSPHPHEDDLFWANVNFQNKGNALFKNIKIIKGAELVGRKYEPPFPWLKDEALAGKLPGYTPEDFASAWTIYHADYVELGEEGTGAVHLAPAYGDEDMQLAKQHAIPIVHHVDTNGHFLPWVAGFHCQLVKPKDDDDAGVSHLDADIDVVKALKEAGRLFKKENITHSYPHCWRCDTPLLNYATTSWFVNVPKIKDKLVAANAAVHWVPEHVGKNRFGDWLEGARDWAVSRQRYWGAPLPIWKNPQTGTYKVFGSLAELQEYVPRSGNTYYLMRHGEAESNLEGIISANPANHDPLTPHGEVQVAEAATALRDAGIDLIIHSGFERTRQTAEQVAVALGLSSEQVLEDTRIGELQAGAAMEGKTWADYNAQFPSWTDRYRVSLPDGENRRDIQVRMGQCLFALEQKYQGKRILIVSHAGALFALESAAKGWTPEDAKRFHDASNTASTTIYFRNAEVRTLDFTPYPHNDHYELDFHRPYIDEIELYEDGVKLERVPDVFDCWFESGSMPYGQYHYPFENEAAFEQALFPANFIAEGLDQTRGWFYSLIVLGVALFGRSPFENVIVNGLALAEDGKKMSKSLRNYPDPMELVDRQGADAMRYYLLTAPIVRGEDLNFSEKEVAELQRKNIGRLHNVLAMYELYADGTAADASSTHVLDRWILARLAQLVTEVTAGYEAYELDRANRPIADFIDDLSVWYVRRSRERLKGDDVLDKQTTLATMRYVLRELAKVMAPALPFYAEYLYRAVRTEDEPVSVHLTAWPTTSVVDEAIMADMQQVRMVVTAALEQRTRSGVKVRQPIAAVAGPALTPEYQAIVCDELNAKTYTVEETGVRIDTLLTPELLAEGAIRELMRAVQDGRKQAGLAPQDVIVLTVATDAAGQQAVAAHQTLLQKTVGASTITLADTTGETVQAGTYTFTFAITTA
jgi:isoleucyl-tRNA synthetase